ncbi:hypothetical protein NLX83_39505 [Allokutzneria sp. A3M-2-11 16]|uniref:hypothetical protein n=1 Tax=Allokutzneria sp. A3M-2-11 16 TaxID=2962043 RepID=UPI0020B84F90|nr:hypothetical protein [Allokutzneria sp. A3M-2-11 16]MCP3805371.1 hypothetical protein [Allokutzneria sp. A3M-2-11 16]
MAGDSVLSFTILGKDRVSPTLLKVAKQLDKLQGQLDRFGTVSAKTMAVTSAASLASAAAIGGALGGLPVLFAAVGAAALSSNAEVRQAYSQLGDTIQAETTAAAGALVPYLTQAASDIGASFMRMQGQLAQAFAASGPHLLTLTKGVTDFAENALPGMVVATRSAGPAVKGLADLMSSAGSGTSDFLTALSSGSTAAGTVLTSLGRIVEFTLGRLGGLLAQLAGTAAATMPQVERFVINLVNAVTRLASGALPVLGGGLSIALTVLNGLLVVIEPIANEIGALTGVVLAAGLAWRTWSAISGMLINVGSAVTTYAGGLNAAMPTTAKFATRAGALLAALGGPFGAALGIAVVGLGLLASSQESAAERTQRHTSFARNLTTALRDSSGAMNQSVRATVAADQSVQDAITSAKAFGIASDQVVDAVLGQGTALADLRGHLQEVIRANTSYVENAKTGLSRPVHNERAQEAQKLLGDLDALNKKTGEAATGQRDYAKAIQSSGRSMLDSTAAGSGLSKAIKVLKDTASDADTKARALKDALDALTGGGLNLEQSQAKVNSHLLQLQDLFGRNIDKAEGFGRALLNADGSVNTMTKNGQSLFSTLTGLRDSTAEAAQKTYELAIQQGQSVPQAMEKARGVVQTSRDSFVNMATQMGLTRDQAQQLADRMHLIPGLVETLIRAPGLTPTQLELLVLKSRFDAVPNSKSITVTSLTREAQAELERVGFIVTRLPNGQVRVDAKTEGAKAELNEITKPRTVNVNVRVVGNSSIRIGGPNPMGALGGIVEPMAEGGIRALTPMSGSIARMVPPNSWRVVGDRLTGTEAFIPLDGSARSMAILAEANRRMGFGVGLGGGGQEVHYHLTIVQAGNSTVDLQAQFARMEQLAGI